MPEASVPALEVVNVRKSYKGRGRVLDNVTFSVESGRIIALAGANGAGKSTLLRCLSGILKFRGEARVCGEDLHGKPAVRRLLGYLPQSVALPETATVVEVLVFFARLRGADPDDLVVPETFLPDFGARIGTLSGGQRQRVAIAVSLLGRPRLLLLDEPVANLDEEGRESFWEILTDLKADGSTSIVASPSPGDLSAVPDRVIRLEEGRFDDGGESA